MKLENQLVRHTLVQGGCALGRGSQGPASPAPEVPQERVARVPGPQHPLLRRAGLFRAAATQARPQDLGTRASGSHADTGSGHPPQSSPRSSHRTKSPTPNPVRNLRGAKQSSHTYEHMKEEGLSDTHLYI